MKLYHATDYQNKKSIEDNGLFPTDCGNARTNMPTLQGRGYYGVYGFISLEDAIEFGRDNNYETVVYEFEVDADSVIDDPEYDGNAKFYSTDCPVEARVVYYMYE